MKFHKEGIPSLILVVLAGIVLNVISYAFFADMLIVKALIWAASIFLLIVILQFFRDPTRIFSIDDNKIICPADGKVVVIEETTETEWFKDKRIQVSVFMSPINVHINRNPISGVVKYFKYHPGLYLVAWHPKSSTDNERTTVVVEHSSGKQILFRQIAGALARRIVWYVKEGDKVEQCEQFGFIKFGSRVDIYLPVGSQVNVKINEVVKGGQTVLATFN